LLLLLLLPPLLLLLLLLLQVTAPQWADDPQLVGWLRSTLGLPLPWLHSAQVRLRF
jgi:hypothetical protein